MSTFQIGDKAIALYDFVKDQPEDLNVWKGDQLKIVNNNVGEGWVLAQNTQTLEEGLVPEAYLQFTESGAAVAPPMPPPVAQNNASTFYTGANASDARLKSNSLENSLEDYDNIESYDDFGSDEDSDQESTIKGEKRTSSNLRKEKVSGAGIISRLTHTTSGAIADFIAGVNLPSDKPSQTFVINFPNSKPMWAHNEGFLVNFGKRQDSSKFASLKKFVVYSVTPTSTNRTVLRRYKHFDWLCDRLQELYPAVAVPALPDAKVTGHDEVFIRDREQKLLQWINKMSLHPVISQSEVFQHFVLVSEKDEKRWKNGKRKAEKDPYKDINSYLIFTGDALSQGCVNSKRVLPALEAYNKHATEVDKHSKASITALRTLANTYRGPIKSSYTTLGKNISGLGTEIRKCLSGNYSDLICQPNTTSLGYAFESVGSTFCKVGEKFESQSEKDLEVIENKLWVQTGSLEHLPSMLRTNTLASETCANKAATNGEGSLDRLTKLQAATLAEINHIQVTSPHEYLDMMKTAVSEQINFYKSLVELLEPQLNILNEIDLNNQSQ